LTTRVHRRPFNDAVALHLRNLQLSRDAVSSAFCCSSGRTATNVSKATDAPHSGKCDRFGNSWKLMVKRFGPVPRRVHPLPIRTAHPPGLFQLIRVCFFAFYSRASVLIRRSTKSCGGICIFWLPLNEGRCRHLAPPRGTGRYCTILINISTLDV
jgi:hypothetical protein